MQMFVALADSGSFRGAARNLNISQSALSIAISQLESALEVVLFDRTTRSISLSPIGRDFLGPVRRILADLDHTLGDIEAVADGRKGSVTVACLFSVATRVMPAILRDLRAEAPGVTVTVQDATTHEIVRRVARGEADIGICGEVDLEETLRFEPLVEDHFDAVLPRGHPLAGEASITWAALIAHPIVAMAAGTQMREQMDKALQERKIRLIPVIEAWHDAILTELVRLGVGATALPALVGADQGGEVIRRPLTDPVVKRIVGVVTSRRQSLSPAASLLLDRLVHTLTPDGIVARLGGPAGAQDG